MHESCQTRWLHVGEAWSRDFLGKWLSSGPLHQDGPFWMKRRRRMLYREGVVVVKARSLSFQRLPVSARQAFRTPEIVTPT